MSNGHTGHDDVQNADVAHTEASGDNVSNTMTWRREIDGKLFIKVSDFPHDHFAGESMWVEVSEGDELQGVGYLRNHPTGSSLEFGDIIRYGGGTEELKPVFLGKA